MASIATVTSRKGSNLQIVAHLMGGGFGVGGEGYRPFFGSKLSPYFTAAGA
jgi:hypothetical protein